MVPSNPLTRMCLVNNFRSRFIGLMSRWPLQAISKNVAEFALNGSAVGPFMDSLSDFLFHRCFFIVVSCVYTAGLLLGDGLNIFLGPRILRVMNNE